MMLTRCPGCDTTFRVTPEQVKARHGKVRCGRCQHVFDAIEYLVEAAPAVTSPVVPDNDVTIAASELEFVAATADPVAETAAEPAALEEPAPVAEMVPDAPRSPPPESLDTPASPPSPLSSDYLLAETAAHTPNWPWVVASILVLLALIAQLLLAYRVDLAAKYPGLRPTLEALCEQAHCIVELPSNPEQVSIEASDLHPARKGGLELSATLKNRATHAQTWPHLELTLTDGADKPIVRKVIPPAQYLPAAQSERDGFAANGELALQLQFDAGNLPAAGYRLYLFYP